MADAKPIPPPTAEDMARDPVADLEVWDHSTNAVGVPLGLWIRRAVAAEAECKRLRGFLKVCCGSVRALQARLRDEHGEGHQS